MIRRWRLLALIVVVLASASGAAQSAQWTPDKWVDEDTIKLCTRSTGEEYCFPVWMVVLQGEVYLRLGTKAAERISKAGLGEAGGMARTGDTLTVEIAGQRFNNVAAVTSPAMVRPVADAMAKKYWMDLVVRFLPHPMTVMLAPDLVVP